MIVKAQEAKHSVFQGVNFEVLAVGVETMVTKMHYEPGNFVSFHSHPNEQSGYVISGKYRLNVGDQEDILTTGDSYSIPANVLHSIEVLETSRKSCQSTISPFLHQFLHQF